MRKTCAGLLGIAAIALSNVASAGDKVAADAFFTQGMNALKANDFAGACTAFKASEEADPSSGTEINLGVCNEKLGKLASAWHWYSEAARTAPTQNRPDRAEQAKREAERLYPKTHKLVMVFADHADDLTIKRDGDESKVPAGLNQLEVPIDPGAHTIEVSAKGKKPLKKEITANMAIPSDRLEFPKLEDAPEEKPPPNVPPGGPGQDYKPPEPASSGGTQRTVGLVVGGVGILAVLAAGGIAIFNLAVTNQDYKKVKDDYTNNNCDDPTKHNVPPCGNSPSGQKGLVDSLQSKDDARHANQTAWIVTGVAGIVAVGAGVVLLVTAGGGSKSTTTGQSTVTVTPTFGFGSAGLGGTF